MRPVLTAICPLVISSASAEEEGSFLRGLGATTCGEFGALYRQQPKVIKDQYMQWTLGFLSGVNSSSSKQYRDLAAKSPEELRFSLRRYWDEHPLATYWQAVVASSRRAARSAF
jgi:hypothetical protein